MALSMVSYNAIVSFYQVKCRNNYVWCNVYV